MARGFHEELGRALKIQRNTKIGDLTRTMRLVIQLLDGTARIKALGKSIDEGGTVTEIIVTAENDIDTNKEWADQIDIMADASDRLFNAKNSDEFYVEMLKLAAVLSPDYRGLEPGEMYERAGCKLLEMAPEAMKK